MNTRLRLARTLLTRQGVIFLSIDDNEQAALKLLCDEIFGEENFVANIVIKSNPRGSQSSKEIASVHEYLLVYAKDILSAAIIGAVTFLLCFLGVHIGKRFGTHLAGRATIVGGLILIGIGIEIFVKGVFFS